jgi:hypothetical protein
MDTARHATPDRPSRSHGTASRSTNRTGVPTATPAGSPTTATWITLESRPRIATTPTVNTVAPVARSLRTSPVPMSITFASGAITHMNPANAVSFTGIDLTRTTCLSLERLDISSSTHYDENVCSIRSSGLGDVNDLS